jgi:putative ABC transport system permease protein
MLSEIRHALRRLRATPGVTLSAVVCLSIGVWMTCIVSAIGGGYFRPRLYVPAPEQLVQIDEHGLFATKENIDRATFDRTTSAAVLDSLAKQKVFAAIGYYEPTFAWIDGEKRGRRATMLSSGMMDVLGMRVELGRRFVVADDSMPAAIISHAMWRTMFGSDPNVIGRRVQLRYPRVWVQIVGVAPESFAFPRNIGRVDVFLSAGVSASRERSISSLTGVISSRDLSRTVLARLRDGQSLRAAREVVREIALRTVASDRQAMANALREAYRRGQGPTLVMGPVDVRVSRYYNEPLRDTSFAVLVLGCGIAVALIAASNVINLLLIRGASRRQEIAVRLALGANRLQIVNGLVIEAALVAGVGTIVGFAVAFWQWQRLDPSIDGRYWLGQIEWSTFPTALLAGLVLTLIVSVWPGLRATTMNIEQVLRDTRRAGMNASPLDSVLGRLVAASTAGTVMLMVCAILLAVSADQWVWDSGLRPRKGLTSILTFDDAQPRAQRAALAQQVLSRVRGMNDIGYAVFGGVPNDADQRELFGSAGGGPGRRFTATQLYDVSDGWFEAMNVRISGGRRFVAGEARDSTNHVIISQSMASALFGGQNAVNRTFRYWSSDSVAVEAVVIGVAETQAGGSRYQLYRPFGQVAPAHTTLVIGANSTGAIASPSTINKALRAMAGVLSSDVEALDAKPVSLPKIFNYLMIAFVMFATVGIALGAIGMYGVIAYSVVRRTHEIGVRIALGADRARVIWMILEQGLKITLIGTAFGLILSYWSTRLLGAFVEDIKVNYPLTMAGVILLVSAVAVVACLIPGYRAGRLNPVDALRAE